MKKKIASIAVALVAMFALTANAQQTTTTDSSAACPVEKCAKAAKCGKKVCDKKSDRKCVDMFANLNLTDAQKQALQELKKTCKAKRNENCNGQKCDKETRKANAKACRTECLAKIKTILTPEQYVQFLENNFVNRHQGFNKKGHHNKHHAVKKDGKQSRNS